MRKVLVVILFVFVVFAVVGAYGYLADRPDVLTALLAAGVCLAGLGGVALGMLWTYWVMRTGAEVAVHASNAQANVNAASVGLAREIMRQFGPSPTRVTDVPSLPLLSQSPVTGQSQWLPGLRTFEVNDEDQDRYHHP
jgi:hypothetical protein